jgi:HD-like signal output (HDOD) protein
MLASRATFNQVGSMAFQKAPSKNLTPERLVAELHQLPPVARVLARLQRLLANPESGINDVASLIRLDAALATRIIQISNSVWFGRGESCQTIEDAVSRVGFREVYHLVAVMASGAIVAEPLAAYGRDAMTQWRESVACAFAAETLAARLGEDTSVAYTAGLLHGIGRLAIDHHLVTTGDLLKRLSDEGFPLDHSGAEFALLGFNQADVGAYMLEKWDLAPTIVEPIRHQYEPLEADEPHDRMAALLYGARLLRTIVCHHQQPAATGDEEEIFGCLRLSREAVLASLPELQDQLARVHQMTKL